LAAAAHEALQRLTSDDSRRVAEAASKALAVYNTAGLPATEKASRKAEEEAARLAAEREAEKAKQALPKAEDRRAVERAEGEGMVVHPPTLSTAAEPIALEQPTPVEKEDRRAIERAEGEGMTASIPTPVAESRLPAWLDKPWFPIAVLSLGWALASFVGTLTFWFMYKNNDVGASRFAELLALGLIGGAATWLSLRAARLQDRESPPALIIGLMVAIMLVGVWLYPYLQENGVGIDESIAWERAILGTLSGIAMGAVLYRARRVNVQRATLIAAGWATGSSVAASLGLGIYNLFGDNPTDGIYNALINALPYDLTVALIPWVDALIRGVTGALAGAVSGWVMLGQIRRQYDS
jgi:hypothetical protein